MELGFHLEKHPKSTEPKKKYMQLYSHAFWKCYVCLQANNTDFDISGHGSMYHLNLQDVN